MRAAFCVLFAVVIFVYLMPLQVAPRPWAGPDVLLAMTFAWATRRPEFVPMALIAFLFLLADFLFQRPPGLWALLALIATEWLKSRERRQRHQSFVLEWASVAAMVLFVAVVNRLVLKIVIIEPGPLSLSAMQAMMTILVYPVVVIVTRLVFRVRRYVPGDSE